MAKSYWLKMNVQSLYDEQAVKSWFGSLMAPGAKVESAEILCDSETERGKKLRCIVMHLSGHRFRYTLTNGSKTISIKRERLAS